MLYDIQQDVVIELCNKNWQKMLVVSYVETFDFSHFHRNTHKLNILDIWILGILLLQFLSFYFDWPLMQKGEGKWSCNCNAGSFFESISKRTIWVNYLRILFPQKSPFGTHHINEHICMITDNAKDGCQNKAVMFHWPRSLRCVS